MTHSVDSVIGGGKGEHKFGQHDSGCTQLQGINQGQIVIEVVRQGECAESQNRRIAGQSESRKTMSD